MLIKTVTMLECLVYVY